MTNYLVTNSNDTGSGSLREAIALANANPGLDTIEIVDIEEIKLQTELEISDSLNIDGNGTVITQEGTEQGIFFIHDGDDNVFTDNSLQDLTLIGGNSPFEGGAIATGENLVVDGVNFINNSAVGVGGAIFAMFAEVEVRNSTFEDNFIITDEDGISEGAAIYFDNATGSVEKSKFTNSAALASTIDATGSLVTITDSEVSNNDAGGIGISFGRGIIDNILVADNDGGAIVLFTANADIDSSTITGNTNNFAGGISAEGLDTNITNTLIENNVGITSTGGVSSGNDANLTLTNSIVRGNSAPLGAALETYTDGQIIVTDSLIEDNVGENPIFGEGITFSGLNADNPNGQLPEGQIGYQSKFDVSVVEEPVVEEPIVEEPVMEEPVVEEPIVEEPVVEEPIVEEPVMEEPVVEEPVVEEPVVEEPVMEEPVMEEPVVEEPVVEEPVVEEPVMEEPVMEEPVVEEPVVEEPLLQTIEINRSYQADTGVHMFTTGEIGDDSVEERSFSLLSSDVDQLTGETIEGTETIYQFLNSDTDAYLYTMDSVEVDYILDNLDNYSLEGELYGFQSEPQNIEIETVPVYRMLNVDTHTHLFVEGNELASIQENLDNFQLEAKGEAAFYALDI